jgi:hypothetical protein
MSRCRDVAMSRVADPNPHRYPDTDPYLPGARAFPVYVEHMKSSRSPLVLVVHPMLRTAREYAVELSLTGYPSISSDDLSMVHEHQPLSALVLFGSAQWWIGADDERDLPPTVMVGGHSLGLVRAAGVTQCPADASAGQIARALQSVLCLSRNSRGRGTMPMRISSSGAAKVGRWLTVPRFTDFDDDLCSRDQRPTARW